jgi:hypothetical protein
LGDLVPVEAASPPGIPTVTVDNESYDFGVIDESAKGSHDFLFSNQGSAPLRLSKGESTCGCTVSKLDHEILQPGETAPVTVEWSPKGKSGDFREGVTITTNDPNWPQVGLTITGRVTAAVRADPAELVFSHVTAGEEISDTARLFGYLPEPLEIIGHRMINSNTAENFEVTWSPLDPDQVKNESDATSGYLAKITVKPGLPPGPFQQTIVFETNVQDVPQVAIQVTGSVGGDIAVVGPGWSEKTGILSLGTVSGREGAEWTLLVVVRGPHRKEVQLKLAEVVPDVLEVDEEALGQLSEVPGGAVSQAALKIRIPPGSKPANRLGSELGRSGRIVIETGHPTVPRLVLYVRFAVAG